MRALSQLWTQGLYVFHNLWLQELKVFWVTFLQSNQSKPSVPIGKQGCAVGLLSNQMTTWLLDFQWTWLTPKFGWLTLKVDFAQFEKYVDLCRKSTWRLPNFSWPNAKVLVAHLQKLTLQIKNWVTLIRKFQDNWNRLRVWRLRLARAAKLVSRRPAVFGQIA